MTKKITVGTYKAMLPSSGDEQTKAAVHDDG